MKNRITVFLVTILFLLLQNTLQSQSHKKTEQDLTQSQVGKNDFCNSLLLFEKKFDIIITDINKTERIQTSTGFDYPISNNVTVTEPNDGDGWYNAQDFGENNHLGEDWNTEAGGNTDCGLPVYAASEGSIVFAGDGGTGWGKVLIVRHQLPNGTLIETLYGHLQSFLKTQGDVNRREQIATIGDGNGAYYCHLHFELRFSNCPSWGSPGPGYSSNVTGWTNPSNYVDANRNFTSPSITVTYPTSGAILYKGTEYQLEWTSVNVNTNVKIEIYKGGKNQNNFVYQIAANDANDGLYPFNPPSNWPNGQPVINGDDYLVAITSVDQAVTSWSPYFSITTRPNQNITITYPTSGAILYKGTEYQLEWTSVNVNTNVKIEIYKGGKNQSNFVYQIAANDANDGLYPFNPPSNWSNGQPVIDGDDYLVAITSVDKAVTGWSPYFSIKTRITGIEINITQTPFEFNLFQNYPNPFNPSTNISFSLSSKSFVSLKVFDLIGREVATLVSEELTAGNHSRQWEAIGMPSGVYFYRLQAGAFNETKKFVLLR